MKAAELRQKSAGERGQDKKKRDDDWRARGKGAALDKEKGARKPRYVRGKSEKIDNRERGEKNGKKVHWVRPGTLAGQAGRQTETRGRGGKKETMPVVMLCWKGNGKGTRKSCGQTEAGRTNRQERQQAWVLRTYKGLA